MKLFYTFFLLAFTQLFFGQNGTINGTIVDDANGSLIPGVNIIIKELKLSTTSDADGKFIIRNVKPGIYDVEFTFIGYQTKIISEVTTTSNEITYLNTSMVEVKNVLEEVVIKTKAKTESVKSLLLMQKNNVSVSDGISSETIKRTPDRTTSDVLKRISGASIQDNKFVIIRGLNDRYNVALLNGAPLPSSEPDRKAFSFDIFPSNMLDNLVITKTASPDLPGEFAGGVVQINTKAVPDKDFQSITVGGGFNTITTFKEQKTYKGSSTDWLGYDNGVRAFPSAIPNSETFFNLSDADKLTIAKSFEYDWSLNDGKFKPNTNFQYSIGRHFEIKKKTLGVLFSLTNNKTNNFSTTERKRYDTPTVLSQNYNDKNYTEQVLTAALGNISLKFNENNFISFKNIFSINSSNLVVDRYGQRDIADGPRVIQADVRWFTSNQIYSGQLNGDHYFSKPKIKLLWTAFYSNIKRSIPNLRRNIYTIEDPNSSDPNLTIPVATIASNNGGPDYGGGMFFSENKETINGGKLDLSKKFNISKELINEFKIGGFAQIRKRDFFARQLQYNTTSNSTFNSSLLNLPNATIFSNQNIGAISPGVSGFTLYEFTKPSDAYDAGSKLNAAYAMLDNRYKKFRLVWGFRFENYLQTLDARITATEEVHLYQKQNDILPSANFIYSVNKKQNIRLSYSKTLNRPEFRELAPFGFYDFTTQFFTQGNPDLKIATIKNYDIRYEIYPGKGQLFSVSYFHKNFTDPIEIKREVANNTVTYRNAVSAVNSGIEIEFRTLLSSIFTSEKASFLDDITLFSNIAIIKSKVDASNFEGSNDSGNRPLQGQSPYIFNAGIQYINKDNGWSFSTNFNRAGNRIYIVGSETNGIPALWEKGRTLIDGQIVKSFHKNKMELKLNIQNILAQDLIFYENNYTNKATYGALETLANQIFTSDYHYQNGYSEKDDDLRWRTKFGRTFSLSFTYNF